MPVCDRAGAGQNNPKDGALRCPKLATVEDKMELRKKRKGPKVIKKNLQSDDKYIENYTSAVTIDTR